MVRISLAKSLNSYRGKSGDVSRSSSPKAAVREQGKPASLILKVVVIKARNLAAKDRNGTSDPYLVVSLGDAKSVTHAVNKTLNPDWNVTFELPIVGSQSLLLECVCWDKDRFGKDYLGELNVHVEELFQGTEAKLEPRWYALTSKRKNAVISGEIQLQFSLSDPADPSATPSDLLRKFDQLWQSDISPDDADDDDDDDEIERLQNAGVDDGGAGSDVTPDESTKSETAEKKKRRLRLAALKKKKTARAYEFGNGSDCVGIIFLEIGKLTDLPPERNVTRTSFDMDPFVVVSLGRKTYRTRVIRHNLNPVFDEKMIFQVMRHEKSYSLSFAVVDRDKLSGNDFVGTANLPLQEILSVAPQADPETGLYQLSQPIESPNLSLPTTKSRFRLPLSRSSSSQSLSKIAARPLLKPKSSGTSLSTQALQQADSPITPTISSDSTFLSPSPTTHSYEAEINPLEAAQEDPDLKSYTIPLPLKNKDRWEDKHSPELFLKAKYLPYAALRQQFWRAMLKQYDADESGLISKVELSTMLDSLGSTLKESTIDGFFQRFSKGKGKEDIANIELTFDEAVICLEDQLTLPSGKKSLTDKIKAHLPSSLVPNQGDDSGTETPTATSSPGTPLTSEPSQTAITPTISVEAFGSKGEEGESLDKDDLNDDKGEEHVIEIRECPICHQPRLEKRSDADIVTHIATCASQDWRKVNNLVMAGFVTSSQAQRKWYSKVITKISYGGYKLGANSANILVQDRTTGQIQEEKMSVYVRLGIRLLYKGLKSREMEKKRIRKLLKSLSVKQGRKFDDPLSAKEIQGFINFHQLDMSEVLLPMEDFKSFNQFFYRALKPGSRPCSAPNNPDIIVSPADCRSIVFNRMEDATKIWVKGREYSVQRLLGAAYPQDAPRYVNGTLGIFRLAPQDYHRFHIPVDGVLDKPKLIEGEYYTVNPMAIRSALDVYGENVRVIVPINSTNHGRVIMICVGAMMVGSTVITAKEGQSVKRTDELGYFKFGGSTILLLFEPGAMEYDDDLIDNSNGALETLIRVGMSIGHSPDTAPHTPDMQKDHVTQEEKDDAKRRIGGNMAITEPNSS
ncbi:MAG: hypothetical protein M1829_005092 [Trizodia sp. TS-e1964]|nr:MAG: hypothetical protein M1829_005092 [Trizodia sp. TS-e1964]